MNLRGKIIQKALRKHKIPQDQLGKELGYGGTRENQSQSAKRLIYSHEPEDKQSVETALHNLGIDINFESNTFGDNASVNIKSTSDIKAAALKLPPEEQRTLIRILQANLGE